MLLCGSGVAAYAQSDDLIPPVPYAPEDAATITGERVVFRWYILEDAVNYHIQVAHDEQFRQLVLDSWVGDVESYDWDGLTQNNKYFYWRIRGRYMRFPLIYSNTDWSLVQWFFSPAPSEGETSEGEGETFEGEGELVEGETNEGETFEGEGEFVEGEGEVPEGEPVEGEGEAPEGEGEPATLAVPIIRSAPETGAVVESEIPGYYFLLVECYLLEEGETLRFQVAHDDAFTKLIYNQGDIPETRCGYTIQEEGTYFWRIRRENATDAYSDWLARSLTVMFVEEVDEGESQEGEAAKPPQKLTVYISPEESGDVTVEPEMPAEGYPYGTEVVLTATPKTGYRFKRWDSTGSDEPVTEPVLTERIRNEVLVSAVFESEDTGLFSFLECKGCNDTGAEESADEKFRRILGDLLLIGLSLIILLAMRQPSR